MNISIQGHDVRHLALRNSQRTMDPANSSTTAVKQSNGDVRVRCRLLLHCRGLGVLPLI